MSLFYKSHLTARKRDLLIFGYVRLHCHNLLVPLDIIRLFLMMFGDNTIYWKISGEQYRSLLMEQRSDWKLNSSSLKIHNIEFTLQLEQRKHFGSGSTHLILSVSSTETDDQYVITRYTMHCEETKYEYRKFTEKSSDESVEWSEDYMTVSDIKNMKLNAINFVCKIEILHVYQKCDYSVNSGDEMIEAYYSNINMQNKINYQWLISFDSVETKTHSLFEMADIDDKKGHFMSYYSPYIDDNWCLLFTESKTRFGVQLQLLCLPFGILGIIVKWECSIFYKGEYKDKYEETFEFSFESDSVLSHGWNKQDIVTDFWTEYDKDDESKAAMQHKVDVQYVSDIMLQSNIEILVAKEYNENVVFRDNWPLYGIHIVDDIDINDENHRDGHIVIVSDFDEDNFSWNHMISALRREFDGKLNEQRIKYEEELNALKTEIGQLKMSSTKNVTYNINEESAEEVNLWLCSIGMAMYYDMFIQNGFDSIKLVKGINGKYDLIDIGITLKAHQIAIMNGISKLPS